MSPFLQALVASAVSGVFVGLVSWYGNKRTSASFFGSLTKQVEINTKDIGELRNDSKEYRDRIGHLEVARANGAAARFPN